MWWKSLRLVPVLLIGTAAHATVTVQEMAVTTKVSKGKPVDSVHRISCASVKGLYCFTRVAQESDEESIIRHIWYRNGVKEADYQLPVRNSRWRTYSRKQIGQDSSGDWKVEVVDEAGKILKTKEFRIN